MRERQAAASLLSTRFLSRGQISLAQTRDSPTFYHACAQTYPSRQQRRAQSKSAETGPGRIPLVVGHSNGLSDRQLLLVQSQLNPESFSQVSCSLLDREASAPSARTVRSSREHVSTSPCVTLSVAGTPFPVARPKMDPNQPRNWRQSPHGGYAPPMPNSFTQLGTQFGPPCTFNSFWTQPAPWGPPHSAGAFNQPAAQRTPFPAGQPRQQSDGWNQGRFNQPAPQRLPSQDGYPRQQNDERHRGRGWYQTPTQPRRQRQRRNGASGRFPGQHRALAPAWVFPENQPLPYPMDIPTFGPFGATRAVRQNNALNAWTDDLSTVPNPAPFPLNTAAAAAQRSSRNTTRPPGQPARVITSSRRRSTGDAISPPSAESGGVPDPTPSYLMQSSLAPIRAPSPKPILVVIDLNGTLLHRPQKRAPSKFVERPLAKTFLQRCIDRHHVVIWSSARPENVQRMCSQLLDPTYLSRVVAIWGRDRFGLTADDYARRTQCYKRLTRLWTDLVVGASHPQRERGGVWQQGNTVLIDDSAEKARSEPHNAVTLPEFAGDLSEQPQVLTLVGEYLDELAWQTDVSTYIRSRPFIVGARQPLG